MFTCGGGVLSPKPHTFLATIHYATPPAEKGASRSERFKQPLSGSCDATTSARRQHRFLPRGLCRGATGKRRATGNCRAAIRADSHALKKRLPAWFPALTRVA